MLNVRDIIKIHSNLYDRTNFYFKKLDGKVYTLDFILLLNELKKSKMINNKLIILDLNKAILKFDLHECEVLVQNVKKEIQCYKGIKFFFIVNSPKQAAYSFILKRELSSLPFDVIIYCS